MKTQLCESDEEITRAQTKQSLLQQTLYTTMHFLWNTTFSFNKNTPASRKKNPPKDYIKRIMYCTKVNVHVKSANSYLHQFRLFQPTKI